MTDASVDPRLFSRDPAERRAFRDALGAGIGRFIPPELRPLMGFVAGATPSAAVERAGAASMRAVQPGRTGMERLGDVGEVLSETAGVVAPVALATRAGLPAAEAVQEAFMGVSVPARAAAETAFERLNQPGPVPETLYSGFGPTGPRRTADQMREAARARLAERDAMVARLTEDDAPIRFAGGDLTALVSRSPDREGWRVTVFQPDGSPSGHSDAPDKASAVRRALEDQFRPVGLDPRTAAPAPDDFGFRQDNPALSRGDTEWLANKQRVADETYSERRGITGSTTAQLGQSTDMFLPTDFLRRIPGLNRENRRPGDPRYDELLRDVQERGFLPDQDGNRVVLGINHRGEPFLVEGNTRVAVAGDVGVPNVRVEVIYKNGGEMVDGPFSPENVARIAARGPRPENFAQGGAVMMRSDMPEQIHQGVGSLSEVARRMFQGGAVSSNNPLAPYEQYLTQTYAAPIQQSAQQAVGQFVNSVRQKEQQYFGGGMGGGMSSPMQGGLMGSPIPPGGMQMAQHSALQASMPAPDQSGVAPTISGGLGFLGSPPAGAMTASPFGNSLNQQMMGQQRLANETFGPVPDSMRQMPVGGFAQPDQASIQAQLAADAQRRANPFNQQMQMQADALQGRAQGAMTASPFGNSLNQQMMGQRRLDAMQPSGGNEFNAALALQNNGGPMMQSNFDGNRPGATGGRILGAFDIFQMGRNAGIV